MATKKESDSNKAPANKKKSTTKKKSTSKKTSKKTASKKTTKKSSAKQTSAKKKKTDADNIPSELAEEIEQAAAVENEPSAAVKNISLPVTNWEEDHPPDEDHDVVVDTSKTMVTVAKEEPTPAETTIVEDEEETEKKKGPTSISVTVIDDDGPVDEPVTKSTPKIGPVKSVVISEPESESEVDEEPEVVEKLAEPKTEPSDNEDDEETEHEWHILDGDDAEEKADETQTAEAEEDTEERPEWDEEKWRQANVDEEEQERPDWDEEKWQRADASEPEVAKENTEKQAADVDDETEDSPDWDEEKWQSSKSIEDNEEESDGEDKSAVVLEAEADSKLEEVETEETEKATSVTEEEKDTEDDLDVDRMSASQVASNVDQSFKQRSRFNPLTWLSWIARWWQRAKLRNSFAMAIATLLIVVLAVPAPRYIALNSIGVRATASLTVLDDETKLPLKEVSVELADQSAQTNESGLVSFDDVRLGNHTLIITKSAYQKYTRPITIGTGSNQLEPVELTATGTGFEFMIVDWLTDEPIKGAEVTYQENSAFVNDAGVARLNTPDLQAEMIKVNVSAPGYSDQEIEIDTSSTETTDVDMVVSRQHFYVDKRDGTYNVYKIGADGNDEELLITGTGNEKDDMRFDVSPSGKTAVIVATRDANIKNTDGFILSGLYTINPQTGEINKSDSSERIDLIGWIGETIVYVKIQAGASGQNPERHRLMSLDTTGNTNDGHPSEIAASNFFNDVLVAKDFIFYAPSDAYKQNPEAHLFRSNANGSKIETVFKDVVWTVFRSGFDEITFDSDQVWYSGTIDRILNSELDEKPTTFTSRLYTDSPNSRSSAWVDTTSGGKGELHITDTESGEERVLTAQSGLRNPIVWLSNSHIIYRVVTNSETADYVISVAGGEPQKISDVSEVSGADRWYYFY